VLLENVAGILAPLLRGGTCVVLPAARVGLTGSSTFDPQALHAAIEHHGAQSVILLPQMLRAWAAWLQAARVRAPAGLRLVAVGGAAVGAPLLLQARALGLPAYEGYGVSEGASVQTLNLPGADRPGSAGRALPHAQVRIGADGEIEIAGALFLGYLGEPAPPGPWWRTGDLGEIDAAGFLHVRGRRKNVLITAFGRNVSPEWVETALRSQPAIGQAVVFGEARPALSAVVWPSMPGLSDAALAAAVAAANASLPDYARVLRWVKAGAPFDIQHGMATANGRPLRDAILALHRAALERPHPQPDSIDSTETT
jgi:long-subunit acyl-CoA synthetase (AMP-forming)